MSFRLVTTLESAIAWLGKAVAMLVLGMALITLIVVVMRYAFDVGSIALQESVQYMHGALVMLGLAYTLQVDGHVRVDIIYSRFPDDIKRWINLGGHLFFLLPLVVVLIVYSWDFVFASWRVRESSPEVGGLPGVFLLKTLIPLSASLLILQAFCELGKLIVDMRRIAN